MTTITTRSGKGSPLTNDEVDANFTGLNSDKVEASGDSMTGDLSFGDNVKATFGDNDLQLFHDGSHSYVRDSGTGHLKLQGTDVRIQSADGAENFLVADLDGAVRIYNDNTQKFQTTATGIDITGTATMDGLTVDGIASVSATNPKIQLFETDTTNLNTQLQNQAGDFLVSRLDDDAGSLTVHFSIDHSTGNVSIPSGDLDVTGTVTADGLTVDGDITAQDSNPVLLLSDTSASNQSAEISHNAGTTAIKSSNTSTYGAIKLLANNGTSTATRMEVDRFGDISFYDAAGSNQALFWDASAESLGIGVTTNINGTLTLPNDGLISFHDASGNARNSLQFSSGELKHGAAGAGLTTQTFYTNGTERMRIDASGNVGIGVTNVGAPLDIGSASPKIRLTDTGGGYSELRGNNGVITLTADAGNTVANSAVTFETDGSEAMRIDSSGNVGIGASSPSAKLELSSNNNAGTSLNALRFTDTDGSASANQPSGKIEFYTSDFSSAGVASYISGLVGTGAGGRLVFGTGVGGSATERMRIDESGNLLINTTDTDPANNSTNSTADDGVAITAVGEVRSSRYLATENSGAVGFFNRTGTDGDILRIRKSGATIGTIGTKDGFPYFAGTSIGLRISGTQIRPSNSTGVNNDNAVDLGKSDTRFKNLYLSNAVHATHINLEDAGGSYRTALDFDTSSNLKISTGASAGSRAITFFTENAEQMRLDASGNFGIGTSSVANTVHVKTDTDGNGITIQRNSTTANTYGQLGFNQSTNDAGTPNLWIRGYRGSSFTDSYMTFGTGSTTGSERMRIDSSGDLQLSGSTDNIIRSGSNSSRVRIFGGSTESIANGAALTLQGVNHSSGNFVDLASASGGYINFRNGTSNAMRIDSSGNLLVGKTSTTNLGSDTTAGHTLYNIGTARHVASNSPSLQLTRTTSDGNIAVFTKDGATVGSIGVVNTNNLRIGGEVADHAGIQFGTNILIPESGGSAVDGDVDLGYASGRFKDLHLSGKANTGSITTDDSNTQLNKISRTGGPALYVQQGDNTNDILQLRAGNGQAGTGTQHVTVTGTGHLLVGKTSAAVSTVGIELRNNGFFSATRDSSTVGYFNRTTNDGEIVAFRKDNSTVGSIGTTGGKLYIGSQDGSDAFLRFESNEISPCAHNGDFRDDVINLGKSVSRFKDFYLSGEIFNTAAYNQTTGFSANMYVSSAGRFFRSTSSQRYKNTIQDATHGLTELLTLRPVTYKGNDDGDLVFGGLIAEEVHEAGLTEFVQYNEEDQPDALAYGNMVSLCIKAIQEQQATITALEARITQLETN